jgi:hypothetical protein
MEPEWPGREYAATGAASLTLLVVDVLLASLLALAVLRLPVEIRRIFTDFEIEVPILTRWFLFLPGYVYAAGLAVGCALLVAKELALRDGRANLLLNLLALVALLAFGALVVVALLLPLISLINKLS